MENNNINIDSTATTQKLAQRILRATPQKPCTASSSLFISRDTTGSMIHGDGLLDLLGMGWDVPAV